ncbi:MAG: YbjN domain-containing protein [Bacteroidales bacterium]|nr:YbjN domain-containing protein [Bacteroidales bacterium]MDD4217003.1 YbjN domain-containing protein [Bacteroidales bacterium]MDY0141876.1 YbjN domain-containing protein [Bacteroidales bacterium]
MIPYHLSEYIESSIKEVGIDPISAKGQKEGQWTFKYKKSTIWVDVFSYPTNPDKYYFQVMSPLCKMVDENKEEFAIDLLEINYSLYGCWICKKEGWIYVLNLREADNLQKEEIDATIDRVAAYSSEYWGKLSFKYKNAWEVKTQEKPKEQ